MTYHLLLSPGNHEPGVFCLFTKDIGISWKNFSIYLNRFLADFCHANAQERDGEDILKTGM
jgi:hypothetical protein